MKGKKLDYQSLRLNIDAIAADLETGKISIDKLHNAIDWNGMRRKYRALYIAQRGICPICKEIIIPMASLQGPNAPTIEHIIPKSEGGGRGPNILWTHRSCNESKKNEMPTMNMVIDALLAHERAKIWNTGK